MQLAQRKAMFVGAWLVSLGVVASTSSLTSASGLIVLAVLAVVPPIVTLRLWNEPPRMLSHGISEAIR